MTTSDGARERAELRKVIEHCEALIDTPDPEAVLGIIRTALGAEIAPSPEGDALKLQLQALEFDAERIGVYGPARTKSRLAYARALLALPLSEWR